MTVKQDVIPLVRTKQPEKLFELQQGTKLKHKNGIRSSMQMNKGGIYLTKIVFRSCSKQEV